MLKSIVKRMIRQAGFDLKRFDPSRSEDATLMAVLGAHNVNLVFDVGASSGIFGRVLREAGYRGRIVSFEPLSSVREQLLENSRKDSLWEVAPRAAIGSEDGEIEIHIAGNSHSSSVLEMLESHSDAAPESAYVGSEKTPLRRLDSMAPDYLREDSRLFIKVDTQGYEDQVLKGAEHLLPKAVGLQLELSLVPLYKGQCLFAEMVARCKALGFNLWTMSPVFSDSRTGRLLQVDAIFFRD
jgi:FkbM family methyltransferase